MIPERSIDCNEVEYAFLRDFTDAISDHEGRQLSMSQALVRAAMQYRVGRGRMA